MPHGVCSKTGRPYRFRVGQDVVCLSRSDKRWYKGAIVDIDFRLPRWPDWKVACYQVLLDEGTKVVIMFDDHEIIKQYVRSWWTDSLQNERLDTLIRIAAKLAESSELNLHVDYLKRSPLVACIEHGWLEGALELLRLRADPSAVDHNNRNALHWAMMPLSTCCFCEVGGHRKIIFARKDGAVVVKVQHNNEHLGGLEFEEVKVLSYAQDEHTLSWATDDSVCSAQLPILAAHRLSAISDGTRTACMNLPGPTSKDDLVRKLIGAKADLNAQDVDLDNEAMMSSGTSRTGLEQEEHNTPLHLASEAGDSNLCRILLNAQADVDIGNCYKMKPLHVAYENGHTSVALLLLQHRANPNIGHARCGLVHSLLHEAATRKDADFSRSLLECRAEVNAQGRQGMSPLHFAARSGAVNVADVLLAAGADASLRNQSGHTAADLARRNRIVELAAALAPDCLLADREDLLCSARLASNNHQTHA